MVSVRLLKWCTVWPKAKKSTKLQISSSSSPFFIVAKKRVRSTLVDRKRASPPIFYWLVEWGEKPAISVSKNSFTIALVSGTTQSFSFYPSGLGNIIFLLEIFRIPSLSTGTDWRQLSRCCWLWSVRQSLEEQMLALQQVATAWDNQKPRTCATFLLIKILFKTQ